MAIGDENLPVFIDVPQLSLKINKIYSDMYKYECNDVNFFRKISEAQNISPNFNSFETDVTDPNPLYLF